MSGVEFDQVYLSFLSLYFNINAKNVFLLHKFSRRDAFEGHIDDEYVLKTFFFK